MASKKATRRALFSSVISLVLCLAMLVGTTFAWFTDEVVSGINTITAGNLDVELYHSDKADQNEKVTSNIAMFDDVTRWEPGAVAYENFVVKNEGDLALKYQLALNFDSANATKNANGDTLAKVLKVAVVPGGFTGDRAAAHNLAYNYDLSTFALEGELASNASSDTYGVVIYWQPTNNDNAFNLTGGMTINLGVKLFATQLEAESDSFGKDYDDPASGLIPEVESTFGNVNADGSASFAADVAPSATTNTTTIEAPEGAFEATDKVEVKVETTNSLFNITAEGAVVASLDVTMTVNGAETSADLSDGKTYTVTTYISKGLTDVNVSYTGTDGKAQPTDVTYDSATGKLTFKTSHFSEYVVSGKALAYDAAKDTALNDVKDVIEATKQENNTVVIPEANKEEIKAEIDKLPEADRENATDALAVAKIGDTPYATLTEAFAATVDDDSATITLLKNVQIDADNTITVAAGKAITLDLNGKTLSGVSDQTGSNRNMFDANGGTLTVKNGTVTVKHTGANMGWGNSTNVFNVTAGGVLSIENATIENLGGSDMAFCVHLNNWGKVTLNAKNVKFRSTYVGIRAFNSGPDMNDVTLEGCDILTGSSCFWVHNYTKADFGNDATKTATQQALLNLDFSSTTVARTNGSKSLIRFGFTDSIYYSDTAMTEVVAGSEAALKWAIANGKNVLLNNDIELTSTLTVANDVVLDLNGSVLSGTCNAGQGHLIMVNNGATLDIKDSSSAQTGKITYAKGTSDTGWTIDLEGKLNLYSGTIELTGESWSIGYAVDVRPNAWGTNYAEDTVFHMYGGKIVSSDGAIRVASSSSDTYGNIVASFIMDGGEIDADWDGIFVQQSNAAYDTLNVTINNGTVASALSPIRVYAPVATSVNAGTEKKPMTITINGGNLSVKGTPDETRVWHTLGKIVIGGGITLDDLNKYTTITIA